MKKAICLVIASIMALALVACGGNSADKDGTDSVVSVTSETTPAAASESAPAESTQEPAKDIQSEGTHLYDNATVKAVMNGTRTEKIGEYSIIKANSEDCFGGNETMEQMMYNGWLLEYTYDGNESMRDYYNLGMDAEQLVKYVYRGAETKDDQSTQENIKQIEESIQKIELR